MNRQELIHQIYNIQSGVTKKQIDAILITAFQVITKALIDGNPVQLHGFGTFTLRTTKSRKRPDLKTKKPKIYPAFNRVHFKPGQKLKLILNGKFKSNGNEE